MFEGKPHWPIYPKPDATSEELAFLCETFGYRPRAELIPRTMLVLKHPRCFWSPAAYVAGAYALLDYGAGLNDWRKREYRLMHSPTGASLGRYLSAAQARFALKVYAKELPNALLGVDFGDLGTAAKHPDFKAMRELSAALPGKM